MATVAWRLHMGVSGTDEYYFQKAEAEKRMEEEPDYEIEEIRIK